MSQPTGERPQWWTAEDEEILRGELAKLADLPRPAYMQRDMDSLRYTPIEARRRWRVREWGAVVAFFAVLLLILVTMWLPERPAPSPCPGDAAGCADRVTVTPTTYGPDRSATHVQP